MSVLLIAFAALVVGSALVDGLIERYGPNLADSRQHAATETSDLLAELGEPESSRGKDAPALGDSERTAPTPESTASGEPPAEWETLREQSWGDLLVVRQGATGAYADWLGAAAQSRTLVVDETGTTVVDVYPSSHSAWIDDFNGDEKRDLIVLGNSGGVTGCCDFLWVFVQQDGRVEKLVDLSVGRSVSLDLKDLDGDGVDEVLAGVTLSGTDLPYCCIPFVPTVLKWEGTSLVDATRALGDQRLTEALEEYRAGVLGEGDGWSHVPRGAALGLMGAAHAFGGEYVREERTWLQRNASSAVVTWVGEQRSVLEDALRPHGLWSDIPAQ